MMTLAVLTVMLALVQPALFVSGWIVNKAFDAAERFGRFRGTICL